MYLTAGTFRENGKLDAGITECNVNLFSSYDESCKYVATKIYDEVINWNSGIVNIRLFKESIVTAFENKDYSQAIINYEQDILSVSDIKKDIVEFYTIMEREVSFVKKEVAAEVSTTPSGKQIIDNKCYYCGYSGKMISHNDTPTCANCLPQDVLNNLSNVG